MNTFWIIYWIVAIIYVLIMIGMYLVKDYRNGIIYKGFVGKIQNFIKH
jgi:hypothetical protein